VSPIPVVAAGGIVDGRGIAARVDPLAADAYIAAASRAGIHRLG